jgi:hypothetical protein
VLACIANPNGFHILIYPFQTLTSTAMQKFIQEWFSPDFHQLMWQPLAWFILALIGLGMIGKKSIKPTKILVTLVFGYAALISMRNIPLFMITSIPVMAEQIGSMVRIRSTAEPANRLLQFAGINFLVMVVLFTGLCFFRAIREQEKAETQNFPKSAVDWLLENKPKGNLFNSYGWGGYLIWRVYPEYQVYIDGRADLYGDAFIFDYISIYHAEPGWDEKLKSKGVQTVLVESRSPLANMLRETPPWRIMFEDKVSILFER